MVEGARLESVYTGNRIEGSNPSPSASFAKSNFKDRDPFFYRSRDFARKTIYKHFQGR